MNTTDFVAIILVVIVAGVGLFFQVSLPSSPADGIVLFILLMALAGVLIARSRRRAAAPAPKDLNSPEQ